MNRRTFVKSASLTIALNSCGLIKSAEAAHLSTENALAPAEIEMSETKWLLKNGLIQKQLVWTGKTLQGQLAPRYEMLRGEGLPSDLAVATSAGLRPTGNFRFVSASHSADGDLATLDLVFSCEPSLDVTLRYRCRRGDAAIEQSCIVRNAGTQATRDLTHLGPMLLALRMPEMQTTAHWIEGLHDDRTESVEPFRTYRVSSSRLETGDPIQLESDYWSSNTKLPALILTSGELSFFSGLVWSGEWAMTAVQQANAVTVQARLGDFSYMLAPGESFASPACFYGVIRGTADDAWNSIHHHCRQALMPDVPNDFPWVSYNTWYSFGPDLEEQSLKAEVDRAADLGIEVFYLDDGWFIGSNPKGDWGQGPGNWVENPAKFPSGLAKLADYVHARGMKFGLWVEPERVDAKFVDKPGLVARSWLATREAEPVSRGFNGPGGDTPSYQVCFGCPQAREWATESMLRVVRDYHVDWLKWDHNLYRPCSDWRHGHQAGAGNWAHIEGVYGVMQALHDEFPKLIIENCASGGHRFEYGMMRHCRVTWTSDASQPAHLVRSHVFGASHAYPAQYLLTFYIKSSQDLDSISMQPAQIDSLFRSRMLGAIGICDFIAKWPPEIESSARRSIALYKRLRRYLRGQQAWLTPQPTLDGQTMALPTVWDAMQYWLPKSDESVIYAFRSASPANQQILRPKFLASRKRYRVSDEDKRFKPFEGTGGALMREGIPIMSGGINTSAVVYISPV